MSQTQHSRTPSVILVIHLELPSNTHTQLHMDTEPCMSVCFGPQHTRPRYNLSILIHGDHTLLKNMAGGLPKPATHGHTTHVTALSHSTLWMYTHMCRHTLT